MIKKKRSYMGEPYYGSGRRARIYPTLAAARRALRRKGKLGEILQIGSGQHYVILEKGKKYYSK